MIIILVSIAVKLLRCCAGATFGSKFGRFAEQPPRGWFRAAQHAFFGIQHFSSEAGKKMNHHFSKLPEAIFFRPLFLFAVVEKHLLLLAVSSCPFFRHFFLFAVRTTYPKKTFKRRSLFLSGPPNQHARHACGNPWMTCPLVPKKYISTTARTPKGVWSVSRICPSALSGCTTSNERGAPAEFVGGRECPAVKDFTPQMSEVRQQGLVSFPLRRDRHSFE